MNANHKLPQMFIFGTALIASAFACSLVHAADSTVSFTGVIIPATNNAKPSTEKKERTGAVDQKKVSEARLQGEESHAAH